MHATNSAELRTLLRSDDRREHTQTLTTSRAFTRIAQVCFHCTALPAYAFAYTTLLPAIVAEVSNAAAKNLRSASVVRKHR